MLVLHVGRSNVGRRHHAHPVVTHSGRVEHHVGHLGGHRSVQRVGWARHDSDEGTANDRSQERRLEKDRVETSSQSKLGGRGSSRLEQVGDDQGCTWAKRNETFSCRLMSVRRRSNKPWKTTSKSISKPLRLARVRIVIKYKLRRSTVSRRSSAHKRTDITYKGKDFRLM